LNLPVPAPDRAGWRLEREALDLLAMVSVVHRGLKAAVRMPRGGGRG
jgi:hypothetical protein